MNPEMEAPRVRRSPWTGLPGFFGTESRVQLHETPSLVSALVIQVIFLVFVWLLAPPSYRVYAVVGAIVFSIFTVGERVQNEAAYIRLDHKLNELYHASPLAPESYFVGMAAGVLVLYLPPVLMLVVILELVHPLTALPALVFLASLAGIWLFSSSMGYIISTLFRDLRAIWPYSSLLFNLFGVLPPVFYPLAAFPGPLQPVALLMPPSAVAALMMDVMGVAPLAHGQLILAVAGLLVECVGVTLFGLRWARRSAREGG